MNEAKPPLENFLLTVKKDTVLEFPELWMEVYVAGPQFEQRAFAEMLIRGRCTKADTPAEADLVIFTGGEDVNPALYGEVAHPLTRFSLERDKEDIELYEECRSSGIPMMGVCRGAQFLHVMNNGKLYQHVEGHTGDHSMWDTDKSFMINRVSSVHHQMCIENRKGGMILLGETGKDITRWKNPVDKVEGYQQDVEAFFYRDTCCFGVQGHPEYKGYDRFMQWTMKKMEELLINNPDLAMSGRVRRVKEDIVQQRSDTYSKTLSLLH